MIEEVQGLVTDTPVSLVDTNLPGNDAPFSMIETKPAEYNGSEDISWTMDDFWFVGDFDIEMGPDF